jgi:hypothetical protein
LALADDPTPTHLPPGWLLQTGAWDLDCIGLRMLF